MFDFYRKETTMWSSDLRWVPKGPGGTWKTGQRVRETGYYVDQYGVVSFHLVGHTFPPALHRRTECAFRRLVDHVSTY